MTQSRRDHRIDFLRGAALASIFINHVPGNVWEAVTHKNFGFSDAAEVFVLLAGYASAFAYFARYERGERFDAARRAWKRAGVLYVSHLATTLAAIALFCAAAIWFEVPAYLDDSIVYVNLKPFFADPVRGIIGLVTMGHQLGYFNILSMYTVLLLMVPAMLWLAARDLRLLLAASAALWLTSGAFTLDMPNYPLEGGWFFNPFAWQFLFAIGLALGIRARRGVPVKIPAVIVKLAAAYCLLALLWVVFDLWSWQPAIPKDWWWAHHFYMFDKTYVSVPRLLHVLALAVLVTLPPWGAWLKRIPATNLLTAMGRHSLPVFCAGSLLAMAGTILRHELGGSFAVDTLLIGGGLLALGGLAWLLDGGRFARITFGRPAPETLAQSPALQPQ
jgi:hypothetical protein